MYILTFSKQFKASQFKNSLSERVFSELTMSLFLWVFRLNLDTILLGNAGERSETLNRY